MVFLHSKHKISIRDKKMLGLLKTKIRIILLLLVAIIAIGAIGYFAYSKLDKKNVVGYINGSAVTLEEANLRMQEIGGPDLLKKKPNANFNDLDENSKNLVLKEEAIHRILVKDAEKKQVIPSKDLKKELNLLKEEILKKKLLENIANTALNEDKLKAEYKSQSDKIRGQQEIFASHILLANEQEAEKVKKLVGEESFEKLAKERSLDKSTSENGGSLGVLYTGNMLKEFETALLKLEPGQVSAPIKTKYGWHILKLISKKKAVILPYDQVKNNLSIVVAKSAIGQYLEPKIKDIKIEIVKKSDIKSDSNKASDSDIKK